RLVELLGERVVVRDRREIRPRRFGTPRLAGFAGVGELGVIHHFLGVGFAGLALAGIGFLSRGLHLVGACSLGAFGGIRSAVGVVRLRILLALLAVVTALAAGFVAHFERRQKLADRVG